MAKKTAAKKTASKKKRTAAQKRATEKLVAANKKRASRKKASARTGSVSTGRRRSTAKVRGYPGGARRTNPKERYGAETLRWIIVLSDERKTEYVKGNGTTTNPEMAMMFPSATTAKDFAAGLSVAAGVAVKVASINVKMNKNDIEWLVSNQ